MIHPNYAETYPATFSSLFYILAVMPPKRKRSDSETLADRETTLEAKRIRKRATPSLLQPNAPANTAQIPATLRKSDGADIVKRNTSKKKKYIFIFPGALSLPSTGGKIGSLSFLDTRNPILDIQLPLGTLRLLGTLVFPQNAFLSVKPAKGAVQIVDVFETMIVFSEWRWLGDLASNPGTIPAPLPDVLKAPEDDLWRSASVGKKVSGKGSDVIILSSDGESAGLVNSGEDGWAASTTNQVTPLRTNPRRKGRVVNYSQLEDVESSDDDVETINEEDNIQAEKAIKRSTNTKKDAEDILQVIEDVDERDDNPGRAPRRKRRKVDYSGASEGKINCDEFGGRNEDTADRCGGNSSSQKGSRGLQLDDSVELVEALNVEKEEIKSRRDSRRTRRRIKYSQESGDEYAAEDDDHGDEDFAVDGGEGSDVVALD